MAWRARIESVTNNNNQIDVQVNYYDSADTGFITPLASQSFAVQGDTTLAATKNQIITVGQNIRVAQAAAAQYIGQVINVP